MRSRPQPDYILTTQEMKEFILRYKQQRQEGEYCVTFPSLPLVCGYNAVFAPEPQDENVVRVALLEERAELSEAQIAELRQRNDPGEYVSHAALDVWRLFVEIYQISDEYDMQGVRSMLTPTDEGLPHSGMLYFIENQLVGFIGMRAKLYP